MLGNERGKQPRPVTARFSDFKTRETVRKLSYEKREHIKANNLGIGIQFPNEIRESRRKIRPLMRKLQSEGRSVKLVNDKVYVDGQLYRGCPGDAVAVTAYTTTDRGTRKDRQIVVNSLTTCGQNKNRYVLANICCGTMMGHDEEIRYLMQVAGHARLVEKIYPHSTTTNVVASSSKTNEAVLYKKYDGTSKFEWREWKTFLSLQFRALNGIRSYQQFRFTFESPGVIILKKGEDSDETNFCVFRGGKVLRCRPQEVTAADLSRKRKAYLATDVRKYLRAKNKDTMCPLSQE
ncbi:hypothetical protein MAR_015066 [Mya arenaria]|uniref:Uncharacterized protein n=1 Tax=Mya arenaria TaxID=6604 RepID=A0ABY7FHP4_MYAAR|nr:hypothetical protein MAR_015066 [Mya arenaria]